MASSPQSMLISKAHITESHCGILCSCCRVAFLFLDKISRQSHLRKKIFCCCCYFVSFFCLFVFISLFQFTATESLGRWLYYVNINGERMLVITLPLRFCSVPSQSKRQYHPQWVAFLISINLN